MHEPLLERIRQLETSLRRWRLACTMTEIELTDEQRRALAAERRSRSMLWTARRKSGI
jgi:hypothetical protein